MPSNLERDHYMTITTQHTPGPWYNRQHSGNASRVINAPDGAAVFIIYSIEDARLIAAAPELLEACRTALFNEGGWAAWQEQVRAAIARATGDA
jgi:hypothetical protein